MSRNLSGGKDPARRTSRPLARAAVIALALGVGLAACSKEEPEPGAAKPAAPAPGQPAAPAAPATPPPAVADTVAAQSAEELRKNASSALREQRLYSPAGDNAMEYYLALRDKDPKDASVVGALVDLFPYALIAAEQAIAKNDLTEAQRLYALMEKADAQAPALPRIQEAIVRAQTEADRRTQAEAERLARQQAEAEAAARAREQAAAAAAAQQAAAPPAAPEPATPAPAQPDSAPPTAATEPSAPAAPSGPPRAISTPRPGYPPDAYRRQVEGEVEFEFTIASDGSVSNVRILRAEPRNTFDREVVSTVRRWRFEAPGEPYTMRQTIAFNL